MEKLWLLDESTYTELSARWEGFNPDPEMVARFEADARAESEALAPSASGDFTIPVKGVITDSPDFMAEFFGGGNTTYSDIRMSIAAAESDPRVERIVLDINSPGGAATAEWVETINAVKAATKPVIAQVGNMAASAAYGLAAAADKIYATNAFSQVGSIGIMAAVRTDTGKTTVVSTNAPNKSPDVNTEAGLAVVRQRLDAMETIFIDAVAEGRGVTAGVVKSDFGQGGVLLAADALKNNMIDGINGSATIEQTAAQDEIKTEAIMDLKELKTKHPDAYAAAVEVGANSERERVEAHMVMGEAAGAMDLALTAIKAGDEFTPLYSAKYSAAKMDADSAAALADEDDDSDEALAGAKAPKKPSTKAPKVTAEDEIASALAADFDISLEA